MNLFQKLHHQPVNLGVFPGSGSLTGLCKLLLPDSQLLLHLILHQKIIELVYIVFDTFRGVHVQHIHLCHKTLTQGIHLLQSCFALLILPDVSCKSVGISFSVAKSCLQAIMIQQVHFFRRHIRETAAKIVKYRLVRKILQKQFQSTFHKFNHRVQYNTPGSVYVTGNLHLQELRLHVRGIPFQVSRYHCNITVSDSLSLYQFSDFQTGLMNLFPGGSGLEQVDFLLFLLPLRSIMPKQMLFQKLQCRRLPETMVCIFYDFTFRFPILRRDPFFQISRNRFLCQIPGTGVLFSVCKTDKAIPVPCDLHRLCKSA